MEWQEDSETSKIIKKLEEAPSSVAHYNWDSKELHYNWTHCAYDKFYLYLHEQILDKVIPYAGY